MTKVASPSSGKRVKLVVKNTDLERDPDDQFQTMPHTATDKENLEYGQMDTVG